MKWNYLVIALSFSLFACGGGGGGGTAERATTDPEPELQPQPQPDPEPDPQDDNIVIQFEAVAGSQPIACDTTLSGLGVNDTSVQIRDFRFYVHDPYYITSDNETIPITLVENEWQSESIALLDFENKMGACGDTGTAKTNTALIGVEQDLEGVEITGIGFVVGLPDDVNYADQASASAPLNIPAMQWSKENGYRFMRLDATPENGSAATWDFHLGSQACELDEISGEIAFCFYANQAVIELADYDPATSVVVLDYGKLVANSDLSQDFGGDLGCFSSEEDPECYEVFNALGIDIAFGFSSFAQSAFLLK